MGRYHPVHRIVNLAGGLMNLALVFGIGIPTIWYAADVLYPWWWIWVTRVGGTLIMAEILAHFICFHYCARWNNQSAWLRETRYVTAQKDEELHFIQVGDQNLQVDYYCRHCEKAQPMLTVHCKLCGMCVVRADHHCFIMGACVGLGNQRLFITFLGWACVGGTIALFAYLFPWLYIMSDSDPWTFFTNLTSCSPPGAVLIFLFAMNSGVDEYLAKHGTTMLLSFLCFITFAAMIGAWGFFCLQSYLVLSGRVEHSKKVPLPMTQQSETVVLHDGHHTDGTEIRARVKSTGDRTLEEGKQPYCLAKISQVDGTNLSERMYMVFGKNWLLAILLPIPWKRNHLTSKMIYDFVIPKTRKL